MFNQVFFLKAREQLVLQNATIKAYIPKLPKTLNSKMLKKGLF
jgi:hypothetical protein